MTAAQRALGAILLVALGCSKPSSKGVPSAGLPGEAAADAVGTVEASVDAETAHELGDAAREAAAPRKRRTQEELVLEATQHLSAAANEAKEKKPDCDKIVDLLDVSFATVGPAMTADDKGVFAAYASCAKKAQRWRLLHAVANAIIAGDATQKTTYYLPRALLGLGQYDTAARLSAATLRQWPKEVEAYTTGALANTRVEDWEACSKESDQALLVQHQKGVSDENSAQAHVFKAEALLHQGKIDESSKELDIAKKIKPGEAITKLRERNDVVKSSGVLVEADMPDEVPLGIYPLLLKNTPLTGGLVTLRVSSTSDKPVSIRVEVSLAGVADPIGKSVSVVRGKRETMRLTPPLHADFKVDALKHEEKHDLAYKVSTSDGQVLFEETRSVAVLPRNELPVELEMHQIDTKPVPELAAAWVTPSAKPIALLLEAVKKRAGGELAGKEGPTMPQLKALWDELRERGFAFEREPSIDSESRRAHPARLPSEVVESHVGNALEGSLFFASVFEAMGFDVLLVRVPGHAFVGWVPTKADRADEGAMKLAVQSPVGSAFFLETTSVEAGPSDAAVLRGDAELVDAASKKVLDDGRGSLLRLGALRKMGIVAQVE